VTWYEARDFCAAKGMKLASLKTNSELKAVVKELKHRDHSKKK
jgi:hypothetical protein